MLWRILRTFRMIASGGEDSMIRLWDASTGAHLRTLPGTCGFDLVCGVFSGRSDDRQRRRPHLRHDSALGRQHGGASTNPPGTYEYGLVRGVFIGRSDARQRQQRPHDSDMERLHGGASPNLPRTYESNQVCSVFSGRPEDRQRQQRQHNSDMDYILPNVIVSGPIGTQTGAFDVTIAFDSAVTGFRVVRHCCDQRLRDQPRRQRRRLYSRH